MLSHPGRRLALVVALALIQPPAALAARSPTNDAAALAGRAQREFQGARGTAARDPRLAARRYADAAALYGRAAAALPEDAGHRETRADLLGQAGSAYLEAHRLAPDDAAPLHAARSLARTHLDALAASYGPAAANLGEHAQASSLIREIDALLGVPAEVAAPAPRPPPQRRVDWRRVGLGTSLALAGVSIGAAMGTGFAVTRAPFTGPAYDDIVAAAAASGVPSGPMDDMCTNGAALAATPVISACETRDRIWRASIAMMAVSGVMVASAITFGVLVARARRSRVGVAAAPTPGGAFIAAGARF